MYNLTLTCPPPHVSLSFRGHSQFCRTLHKWKEKEPTRGGTIAGSAKSFLFSFHFFY